MSKIMQINITCGRGSTGDIAVRLYHACAAEGHEARFAYSAFEPTISSAFRIESKWQHYYRRGMNKYFGKRQRNSSPGTKRLIRYIKREKPDLIHIHNVQQNSLNYILFFEWLKTTDIPIVFTLHDCWSFTGGCYHFFKRGCEKYATGSCGSCVVSQDDISVNGGEAYAHKKKNIGANGNIRPVCVSKWLQSVAERSYMGEMKHKPQVIYNGIDTGIFYPRKTDRRRQLGLAESDFVILGVASSWTEEKGFGYLKGLAPILPEGCKLILVGQGLEAASWDGGRVICIPSTETRDRLAELYSCADLYANFSLEETFGLTTAEALACGTPVLVFNTTACPEVMDERSGIRVAFTNDKETDLRAIVDAIETVKASGKAAYTDFCVERIKQHFTTEKMTKSYLELYRSILSGIN